MPESVTLHFSDTTKVRLNVEDGQADATVEAIMSRQGLFASGWIRDPKSDRKIYNIGAVVRLEITRAADPSPRGGSEAPR